MATASPSQSTRRTVYLVVIVLVSAGLALMAVMLPSLQQTISTVPQPGQVAAQDYRAPITKSYESEVLTELRRQAAEEAVQPVYTPPDTTIARQQLEQLRSTLAYISSVRSDPLASINQKLDDLAAMEDVDLSQSTAFELLSLSDTRWQIIQQEALVVLEKVMSTAIRPENVEAARNSVPKLVSLSLPEDQVILVSELATPFVVSTSEYSETLTEAARQIARDSVNPVTRSYVAGQTVVLRGQVLDEADLEALQQFGLIETGGGWKEWVAAVSIVLLLTAFVVLYLYREPELVADLRVLTLVVIMFFLFLFGARLIIPTHTVIPYAYPLAAFGLTVVALFGPQLAIVFSIPLAILVAYGLPNALDLTLYFVLSILMGILTLRRANRWVSFLWAGAAVAVSGSLVIIAYRLTLPTTDAVGLATLIAAAFFNGLATASLTILLQFLLAQFLGMTTAMQLMDLTRPDQPLLQYILREAPGTYQHSLQLANLAEQAAERIGADPLLTRVGALYHDAGKALNPIFFIENQVPGFPNPHNDLDPETSATIIIRHVTDGLELGEKHRLPRSVLDFIAEHHGTMITRYQYVNAVKAVNGDQSLVDRSKFQYPGPRPQSRETGILMLADGCEARVRAERPQEEDQLIALIKDLIDDRVSVGQLDDTNLTLNDLDIILKSFTATMKGIYHPRVKYPQLEGTPPTAGALPEPSEATKPLASHNPAQQSAEVPTSTSTDTESS